MYKKNINQMIIECEFCNEKHTPKDIKSIFNDTISLNDVSLNILPLIYFIIFDTRKICCKKTLMNYIRREFKDIYSKSEALIKKMPETPYIKQVLVLLNK